MQLMMTDDGKVINAVPERLSPEQKKQVLNNNLQRFNLVKTEENGEIKFIQEPLPCRNCSGSRLENSVLCKDCISRQHKQAYSGDWQSRIIELAVAAIIGLIAFGTFHFLVN